MDPTLDVRSLHSVRTATSEPDRFFAHCHHLQRAVASAVPSSRFESMLSLFLGLRRAGHVERARTEAAVSPL